MHLTTFHFPNRQMLNYFTADIFGQPSDFLVKTKFSLGMLIAPLQTYRWRQFLSSHGALADMMHDMPSLRSRIYRPYLSSGLSCGQRTDLLMTHYRLALEAGLGNLTRKTSRQPIPVADLMGRSETRYQLVLGAMDRARQDGELVLKLKHGSHCIYTAAFSLIEENGVRTIKLGGLQGFLAIDDALTIKSVTRDLHGCKPRELMVAALREIAFSLGCPRLILASNRNKLQPSGRICRKSSDYDRLWAEMGAARRMDGDFELAAFSIAGLAAKTTASICIRRKELLKQCMANQVLSFFHTEVHSPRQTALL